MTDMSDDKTSQLKNPMRFSIDRDRTIDIEQQLRHPDFSTKVVTDIRIVGDQMYVRWEEMDS